MIGRVAFHGYLKNHQSYIEKMQQKKRTDRHINESEYRGHPFRVSGIFPSIYHQGSVQYAYLEGTEKYFF